MKARDDMIERLAQRSTSEFVIGIEIGKNLVSRIAEEFSGSELVARRATILHEAGVRAVEHVEDADVIGGYAALYGSAMAVDQEINHLTGVAA